MYYLIRSKLTLVLAYFEKKYTIASGLMPLRPSEEDVTRWRCGEAVRTIWGWLDVRRVVQLRNEILTIIAVLAGLFNLGSKVT